MTSNIDRPAPIRPYFPQKPQSTFPYTSKDLTPQDPSSDASFYNAPRFVTHIDDNAIETLSKYYAKELPKKGRILDFCSSWISHYPQEVQEARKSGDLEVLGMGMNEAELKKNDVLSAFTVQNLNDNPEVVLPKGTKAASEDGLDASTCVVSIDYLTKPVEVLSSLRRLTSDGGTVHLAVSNRCFPTKVVGRWLKIDEEERLDMVGDYLWWAGWRNVEIITLVQGSWLKDPLWVVRAMNTPGSNESAN